MRLTARRPPQRRPLAPYQQQRPLHSRRRCRRRPVRGRPRGPPPAPGIPMLLLMKKTKACQLHAAGLKVENHRAKPPLRSSLHRVGAQHGRRQWHRSRQQVSRRQLPPSQSHSQQQPAARVEKGLLLMWKARRIRTLGARLGLPTSARRQVTCIRPLCLGACAPAAVRPSVDVEEAWRCCTPSSLSDAAEHYSLNNPSL